MNVIDTKAPEAAEKTGLRQGTHWSKRLEQLGANPQPKEMEAARCELQTKLQNNNADAPAVTVDLENFPQLLMYCGWLSASEHAEEVYGLVRPFAKQNGGGRLQQYIDWLINDGKGRSSFHWNSGNREIARALAIAHLWISNGKYTYEQLPQAVEKACEYI